MTPQQISVVAEVATEANNVQHLKPMLEPAKAVVEVVIGKAAVLGAANAGYWPDDNAASRGACCKPVIATLPGSQAASRSAPRGFTPGPLPKGLSARQRMQRTTRGHIINRQRAASMESALCQMRKRQGKAPAASPCAASRPAAAGPEWARRGAPIPRKPEARPPHRSGTPILPSRHLPHSRRTAIRRRPLQQI